ncbi:hypothetical protein [Flavihumibacter fluvii]|uniref:hypothetical protein n=1 Tax=Flavihumibacter fluvii TaxID=2838157 RepID=UPI001BDEB4A8|nr:hypothetical protein [Flavihumibacter fluvii]ULQ51212.1 hypothetical protein KJS93_14070 [Flavihumibacter fluvii]
MDLKKTQKQIRTAKTKIISNMAAHFGRNFKEDAGKYSRGKKPIQAGMDWLFNNLEKISPTGMLKKTLPKWKGTLSKRKDSVRWPGYHIPQASCIM